MDAPTLPLSASQIFDLSLCRQPLEGSVLPGYIMTRRWFGGKAREPRGFEIAEWIPFPMRTGRDPACLALIRVTYADGKAETYTLPLTVFPSDGTNRPVLAELNDGSALVEAIESEDLRSELMRLMVRAGSVAGANGTLVGFPGSMLDEEAETYASRSLKVEQSNTSMIFTDATGTDRLFVKLFRKVEEGMNPDVEITRFLSERKHFTHVPPFGGTLEYRPHGTPEPQVVALALGMVPNDGDAWAFTLGEVDAYYAALRKSGHPAIDFTVPGLLEPGDNPEPVVERLGTYAARAWQLGVRTGQLHLALPDSKEPAFAPEPLSSADLQELAEEIRQSAQRAWGLLASPASRESIPEHLLADLQSVEAEIARRADALAEADIAAQKTRTHGDYHLGQVLNTGSDFVIIDFEGEPLRPLAERKAKRSPLRDVAGMLRSFHYAAHSGLTDAADAAELLPWAEAWAQAVSRIFLRGWLETVGDAPFVPRTREQVKMLLDAFLLEKALYEVAYELNNRPTWVGIPLRGIGAVLPTKVVTRSE